MLDALAFVPGPGVDLATMRHTFDWVWKNWNWPTTWGWDYPAMAMTAAQLQGDPERAVDALLLDTPKNHYGLNGQVYQRPGLTVYLPANGGLLYAVALMAAGWDRVAPAGRRAGFSPTNGRWRRTLGKLKVPPLESRPKMKKIATLATDTTSRVEKFLCKKIPAGLRFLYKAQTK